jgi:phosphatidylserine decarboxylase
MKSRAGHNEFIAREGLIFLIPLLIFAFSAWLKDFSLLSGLFLLLAFCVACFFRNPERNGPQDEDAVLSSADGKVTSIKPDVVSGLTGNGPFTRVSVFMSVFNVHVNRWPVSGRVTRIRHIKGSFLDARQADSSEVNERNAISIESPSGQFEVVQIAGKIARRIACWARENEYVTRGERLGLIRFGSRVDLYLPPQASIQVSEGDHVKAGVTIIARFTKSHPKQGV